MFGRPDEPDPVVEDVVHGVRAWTIEEKRRKGPGLIGYGASMWEMGGNPTRARCQRSRRLLVIPRHWPFRRPPVGDCTCGLYANHPWARNLDYDYLDLVNKPFDFGIPVFGVVEAWGSLELHEEGFRAEYARPVTLFTTNDRPEDEIRLHEEVARRYRCDLVLVDSVEQLKMELMVFDRALERTFVEEAMEPVFAPPRQLTWKEPWDWPRLVLGRMFWALEKVLEAVFLVGMVLGKAILYGFITYVVVSVYAGFAILGVMLVIEIVKAIAA